MSSKAKSSAAAGGASALVPKLRFPEFQDAPAWEPVSLRRTSVPVNERVGERKLTPVSISAGIGFVPQAEKFGRDISGNQYQLYTLVRDGDFVFNKGNSLKFPQGCIYLLQGWGQVAAPNVFIAFRLKDGYSNGFFQNCFEQNQHGKQLKKHITSGARSNGLLNISKDTFFGIEIATPTLLEQQKIADCLASADALIEAQGRKVETLRAHKKGLMQRLFPRPERIEDGIKIPAETFPRLQFTEFQDSKNWKVMTIQEMIDDHLIIGHLDGNHGELYPKAEEFSPNKEGIPYLSANDFLHGSVDFSKCKRLPIARARLFKKGVAKDGDILFAHNATVGPVAKLETDEKFVILSTTATYFRCNREKLSNDFLKFALSSPAFVAQYTPVMAQSTRNQVPITTQRTLRLHVPKPAEQQRIADCLTSLDDLIAAEARKLDTLKTHKKGLMQQLFPQVEEDDA